MPRPSRGCRPRHDCATLSLATNKIPAPLGTAATGGGTGRSINAYSPQDGRWHQAWLCSGGLWLHPSGGLRDGAMVLEGTVGRAPRVVQQRITWTPMDDGSVRPFWEQSADGGATWTVAFDGRYTKRK